MRQKTDQQVTADKLVAALKQDRFVLYRQPIKPIRSAADITGYQEILIHYLDEEKKLLPPGGGFCAHELQWRVRRGELLQALGVSLGETP